MVLADTYEKTQQYILEMPKFTKKNSLDDTRLFLEILGSPEKDKKIIHVAGTNGKGSVCAYLCSVLTKAGYRTGMFTSPHLVEMRERFRIGKTLITEERFLQGFLMVMGRLEEMREKSGKTEYHPTFFELLFLMGMVIFREEKVEYIVLETGLGGRLDATNAVQTPVLTAITSIGYDHMEYLGNTIEEIAGEKAGILKQGIPVIFCDKRKEASEIIQKRAQGLGNKAIGVKPEEYFYNKLTNKSIDFFMHSLYYGYIRLKLATAALYQAENAALAIRCIEQLPDCRGMRGEQIQEALEETFWEGRMEEILPGVFVDGAHNEDGIRAFVRSVEADGCRGRRYLLFSAVGDKDYEGMIDVLKGSRLFTEAVAVGIHDIRGIRPKSLAGYFDGMDCSFAADVIEALYDLLSRKREEDFIYIAGSLYLVGEVKAWFRRKSDD
jgi:dihydrofolate synthase/folylpolyglutamate synthase